MTLAQDSYAFISHPHGPILPEGSFAPQLAISRPFGVLGESHIMGESSGRPLSCLFDVIGHANIESLANDLEELASKFNTLTGDLTITIGGSTQTYPECTFIGFSPTRDMFLDGSGVNGWCQFGRLHWIQRRRAIV